MTVNSESFDEARAGIDRQRPKLLPMITPALSCVIPEKVSIRRVIAPMV
jgi:hypothetical protein